MPHNAPAGRGWPDGHPVRGEAAEGDVGGSTYD